jgi:hypothetical protein
MRPEPNKKYTKSENPRCIQFAWHNDARLIVPSIYSIGAGIHYFGFPVILSLRSFQLIGHSGYSPENKEI